MLWFIINVFLIQCSTCVAFIKCTLRELCIIFCCFSTCICPSFSLRWGICLRMDFIKFLVLPQCSYIFCTSIVSKPFHKFKSKVFASVSTACADFTLQKGFAGEFSRESNKIWSFWHKTLNLIMIFKDFSAQSKQWKTRKKLSLKESAQDLMKWKF